MIYYYRYPAHYQTKTLHLTMEQDGAYTRLMDWYYANERGIPHAQRYAIARAQKASERAATDVVLAEFFELREDVWRQDRCETEIEKAQPKKKAARENGKKGGRPKKAAQTPPEETDEKPNGFPMGSGMGTQEEPNAKAHQPPTTSIPPDTSHPPDGLLGQNPGAGVGVIPTEVGRAAAALRRRQVAVTSWDKALHDAVAAGVTTEHLLDLAELYPGKPAGYLITAALRQLREGVTTTNAEAPAHAASHPRESGYDQAARQRADARRRAGIDPDPGNAGDDRRGGGGGDAIDVEWRDVGPGADDAAGPVGEVR